MLLDVTFDENGDLDRESFMTKVVNGKQQVTATLPPRRRNSRRFRRMPSARGQALAVPGGSPCSSAAPSAASASSSSSERPLTPTPPATTPSMRTGMPPPNPA